MRKSKEAKLRYLIQRIEDGLLTIKYGKNCELMADLERVHAIVVLAREELQPGPKP